MSDDLAALQHRLPGLMLRDEQRLRRRLSGAGRIRDAAKRRATLAQITADVATAERRVERRRAAVPTPRYPDNLPVSARRDDLLAAIGDHQVVIVSGETGSGKTTQLPKICLELGRGVRGLIGHTQPRRLAARTVAERIAEELGTDLGDTVGYTVRFTDRVGEHTLIRLMTDGILLAEIHRDPLLSRYDTILIDEAHERSLNIDFLLGYLRQLLPRRPDLKVVITSATIDSARFSRHFGDAPVIEVSGRTYPVEIRYRPVLDPDTQDERERDQPQAICDAVQELCEEGPGDILVFLSGEREIRDAADALRELRLRDTEILPLFARLSTAEQHRVFQPHPGRRVVLATNVAETSLTVPGIRYVVDTGTARISRYSHRTKVQRLPIEPVSRASANQRAGRCGRVADGICIRLYSEADFIGRPEYGEPEILRTNLASVILQMAALGLGDVAAFPFVDPPDRRNIRDGVQLLEELGALDPRAATLDQRLTPIGRQLAQLPVDPRIGRMILEGQRNGCLAEVVVIAAALSIQDPRERPIDRQAAADQKHARFKDESSDFISYLSLWRFLQDQQRQLSSSQFRRLCRTDFLHYLRVREWQDLVGQLRQAVKALHLGPTDGSTPATSEQIHLALLAGLLSHVGVRDSERRDYLGARGARFAISPGSALFKHPPGWVVAAELVETSRLWGRVVARIEPQWAERLAEHLVKRSYSEPHWEKKRGAVMAYEKVLLYGIPLVSARKVNYSKVDPAFCRELFIGKALVEGEWETHHRFFADNRGLLEEVADLEDRVRRRDLLVDDETLFNFYDERIPEDIVSARHFDAWWKKARRTHPDLLTFSRQMVVTEAAQRVSEADYPECWRQGDLTLGLTYEFEPGSDADGVTVHVPIAVLNRLEQTDFEWQVPGLRHDLVTALIRSLDKPVRRELAPAPDHAAAVLQAVQHRSGPLLEVLERELGRMRGIEIRRDNWHPERVPDHLRMRFRVEDEAGRALAEGRDLAVIKRRLRPAVERTLSGLADGIERDGVRAWNFGDLPRVLEQRHGGHVTRGFPALIDKGDCVSVRVLGTEHEQARASWAGTRRLLLLGTPSPIPAAVKRLPNRAKLALVANPYGSVPALLEDCLVAAVDKVMAGRGGPAWTAAEFMRLRDAVAAEAPDQMVRIATVVSELLPLAQDVDRRLRSFTPGSLRPSLEDAAAALHGLVHRNFVSEVGAGRLPDLRRYLEALLRRLDKLQADPARDRASVERIRVVREEYDAFLAALPPDRRDDPHVAQIRWMIEELRVSLFAQSLGTPYPVSEQRIFRAMDEAAA